MFERTCAVSVGRCLLQPAAENVVQKAALHHKHPQTASFKSVASIILAKDHEHGIFLPSALGSTGVVAIRLVGCAKANSPCLREAAPMMPRRTQHSVRHLQLAKAENVSMIFWDCVT